MAALLDCSEDRIRRTRAFAGIEGDIFVDAARAKALSDEGRALEGASSEGGTPRPKVVERSSQTLLKEYSEDQIADAATEEELEAAQRLNRILIEAKLIA